MGRDDHIFDAALAHGHINGIIAIEKYNYVRKLGEVKVLEEAYYDTIENSISVLWRGNADHQNKPDFYIENTSRKDAKIVGPWTRPDLTLVSYRKFPWTIGHEFEVVTFEVKRPDCCNVLAVFEALSHASVATRAYVVFPIDADAWAKADAAQERRVKDECSRHGVGLILVENVAYDPRPLHIITAQKREIDHEKCSDFLGAVLSEEGKTKISGWK
jgi:hypothetical protein